MKPVLLFLTIFVVCHTCYAKPKTWITLSPHLTEIVFSLDAQDKLLAVSDFSDFPTQASELLSVASHQGVNFEAIVRLKPDLILAWKGGNKPQDLSRLESLGFSLYYSAPQTLNDIGKELIEIGELLGKPEKAAKLAEQFHSQLASLNSQFQRTTPTRVFYYMWPKPIMTIGSGAWANQLLQTCGAENVFAQAPVDYPEVTTEQVISQRPQVIVAAMKTPVEQVREQWQKWQPVLTQQIVTANPDLLHRFTPRVLPELERLCKKLNKFADN